MSTELEVAQSGNVAGVSIAQRLNDHVAALKAAHEIAGMIHKTVRAYDGGVDKDGKRRPGRDEAAVAIYHGQLIGLDPIQSLQNIFVVHGTPSMYARTMKALLIRDGHKVETVESTDRKATVRARHRSAEKWEEATWTMERARRAGYTSNSKYSSDPVGMLYARALAEACRRAAPDVLLGLAYSTEELEAEPAPVRVKSERVTEPADLTGDAASTAGPIVQQWQPSTDEGSTEATEEPLAENPESDSADVSSSGAEPESPPMATNAEQRQLSAQLDRHGITTASAKRKRLAQLVGRSIASAKDLTGEEARTLTERLAALASPAQVAALRSALERDRVHDEQEQLEWIRNNGAPDLASFDDLSAALAEELTGFLTTAQEADRAAATEAPAGEASVAAGTEPESGVE